MDSSAFQAQTIEVESKQQVCPKESAYDCDFILFPSIDPGQYIRGYLHPAYFGNLRKLPNVNKIDGALSEVGRPMDTFNRIPSREDYLSAPPSYVPKRRTRSVNQAGIRGEERFGSLLAAAGIIWAVYILTKNYSGVLNFDSLMPEPLGVSALGILVWLHAKWRRSVNRG